MNDEKMDGLPIMVASLFVSSKTLQQSPGVIVGQHIIWPMG
jgi:hypothetical protein